MINVVTHGTLCVSLADGHYDIFARGRGFGFVFVRGQVCVWLDRATRHEEMNEWKGGKETEKYNNNMRHVKLTERWSVTFWLGQRGKCSDEVVSRAPVCISATVFHGLQGGRRERNRVRQKADRNAERKRKQEEECCQRVNVGT